MNQQNISILGEGSITGGSYKTLRVMGEGRILGDIDVGKLSIMGTLSSESNLKAGILSVSGEGKFCSVDADVIKIMGSARFDGNVKTSLIRVSGEANIKGNIKSQLIKILGSLEGRTAESETFISNGAFELHSLNANDIKVKLRGPCKALEIGGETVNVSYPWFKKILIDTFDILLFRKTKRAGLTADIIEADSIYLEYTVANSVTGNNIVIGPGCKIKNIEYKDTLYIDNGSVVENNLKV